MASVEEFFCVGHYKKSVLEGYLAISPGDTSVLRQRLMIFPMKENAPMGEAISREMTLAPCLSTLYTDL
jgi:hypothetical protein